MNSVFLVRHGENRANITKELSHRHVDYPLTEKGRLQAEQTARHFAALKVDEVYSSPLKRALETAEAIAGGRGDRVRVLEEFREVNVGSLELAPDLDGSWRLYKEIVLGWLAGARERSFPDGENMVDLVERFRRGIAKVLAGKTDRNIVIVGHGGIFTFCVPEICDVGDRRRFFATESSNCAIGELGISMEDGEIRGKLRRWADVGHLHGEAADFVSAMPRD
ncbi:MAG TPA: histidine phosphatase family protein [Rectinemataceae bacterium]|nr:histidine phosphatase family protein [Rectinemataceae bacterium]